MGLYADGTKVAESKSKTEIDSMLQKWRAESIMVGEHDGIGVVAFKMNGRFVQMRVRTPSEADALKANPKLKDRRYLERDELARQGKLREWVLAERARRWRCLVLILKAKFTSVENAVESFEEAFLAHMLIGDGQTVGDVVVPQLTERYKSGAQVAGLLQSGH
jgi:hypothetical protein